MNMLSAEKEKNLELTPSGKFSAAIDGLFNKYGDATVSSTDALFKPRTGEEELRLVPNTELSVNRKMNVNVFPGITEMSILRPLTYVQDEQILIGGRRLMIVQENNQEYTQTIYRVDGGDIFRQTKATVGPNPTPEQVQMLLEEKERNLQRAASFRLMGEEERALEARAFKGDAIQAGELQMVLDVLKQATPLVLVRIG
jgi:hypothetical protein